VACWNVFFRYFNFFLGAPCLGVLAFVALAGCGRSDEVTVPSYNPAGAARQAVALLDENKDGAIDGTELARAPGLQFALPRVDQDGDGKLTSSEIGSRIAYYRSQAVGLTSLQCVVLRNGVPVPDAKVTLVPEEFLKDTIDPATGTTDKSGRAGMKKEGLDFPGLQVGLYRVQISLPNESGQETIPAKYNESTTLGVEVAPDVPERERGIVFDLKIP
jgi:hypothetical protein